MHITLILKKNELHFKNSQIDELPWIDRMCVVWTDSMKDDILLG